MDEFVCCMLVYCIKDLYVFFAGTTVISDKNCVEMVHFVMNIECVLFSHDFYVRGMKAEVRA